MTSTNPPANKNIASRIAFSTIYQTAGKAVAVILGLVNVYLLTRYLGTSGYGQYSIVTAYLSFAMVVADLGLYILTTRDISRPDQDSSKVLTNNFSLRVMSAFIIMSSAVAVAWLLTPYEHEVKLGITFAAVGFAFLAINQVFTGVFQKYFANHILVFGEIVSKSILAGAIILLSYLNQGIVAILASLTIAFAAHLTLTMILAYRYIPYRFQFNPRAWKKTMAEGWPIAFSVILSLVYFKADTIILSIYQSTAAVGIYSLPYKILEVLLTFPGMFVGLLIPLLSARAIGDKEGFGNVLQHGFNFLVYISLLVIIQVYLYAGDIVLFLAGEGFEASASIFKILIIATAFLFTGALFGHAIPVLGLQKKMLWGYGLAATTGLFLYFLLIPKYSYYGAATGTLITEFIIVMYGGTLVMRHIKAKLSFSGFVKGALAAITTFAAGVLLEKINSPWFVSMVFVTVIYILFLYLFKAVTKEYIKLIFPQLNRG